MSAMKNSVGKFRRSSGWTRRQFLSTTAKAFGTAMGAGVVGSGFATIQSSPAASGTERKRIAIVATEVRKYAHPEHFIDRFLEGYGWHGEYHHPSIDLVSLYVDQFPEGDLSRDRARRHSVKIYPSVAEAITQGTSKLAVDGVLIIGEHGRYPKNEKGQTRYPRYKFFKEVMGVFASSGRSAPLFNDKHLSTEWKECVEMVGDSKRLGFPFMAGSSLPVTWRIPGTEIAIGTPLEESVCVCYGGVDSYDFHGLETAQCMSERRLGGEVGVKSIMAVRGEKVWSELAKRKQTRRLLFAALARSHTCTPQPGYTVFTPMIPRAIRNSRRASLGGDSDFDRQTEWIQKCSPRAVAYFVEHLDGFKTTVFLLTGFVLDFTYAGLVKKTGQIISCQMHLPMPPRQTTLADFFNPLVNHIERMILTGEVPNPIERTLLTSGMTMFAVDSLYRDQVMLPTPELKVAYSPSATSAYWRA